MLLVDQYSVKVLELMSNLLNLALLYYESVKKLKT